MTRIDGKDYLARALRHDLADRATQAITEYQHALKLGLDGEDERTAMICLASSYSDLHQPAQARAVINRARRIYPRDPVIDSFAALILFEAGSPRQAIRILGLTLCHNAPHILTGYHLTLTSKFHAIGQSRDGA